MSATTTKKRGARTAQPSAVAAAPSEPAPLAFNLFELRGEDIIEHAVAFLDQHAADRPEAVLCAMERVLGEIGRTEEYWMESEDGDREWADGFHFLARELLHDESLSCAALPAFYQTWFNSQGARSSSKRSNFAGWFADMCHDFTGSVCRHRLGLAPDDGVTGITWPSAHREFIEDLWRFAEECEGIDITGEHSRRALAVDLTAHFVAIAVEYAANERLAAVDPSVSVKVAS